VALSDDQKAMLRLLAQREQGYEDMAALMGVSVEDLRGRVKDALGQLEREGGEAPELPEPPVAPKATPAPKAEPEPPSEPEPKAEATPTPPASPAVPVPPVESEPPELSATPPAGQVPPALPPESPKSSGGGNGDGRKQSLSLSSNGAKVAVAAIIGALVIVVVILLVSGGGDGNDSSTGQETNATANEAESTAENTAAGGSAVQEAEEAAEATPGKKEPTKAILTGDSEAHGVAIFGRVKEKLALQFVAEGLEQLPKQQAYTIWVAASPKKMLPLALSPVNAEGKIASQFEVTTELLGYLATEVFDEIAVTRTSIPKLNAALKEATKKGESPAYTGVEVMRGKITGAIVGAAKRLEEQEAAKEGGKAGE